MKVLVSGRHDWTSPAQVWKVLNAVHKEFPITELMRGGVKGVDRFAKEWCAKHPSIQTYLCRADWDAYKSKAVALRNLRMMEWEPDMIVAFIDKKQPFNLLSSDLLQEAKKAGYELLKRELSCQIYTKRGLHPKLYRSISIESPKNIAKSWNFGLRESNTRTSLPN